MIIGLDLSLTSTGFYALDPSDAHAHIGGLLVPPKGLVGVQRLDWLHRELKETIHRTRATSAFIEGYSFGSQSRAHSIGEWGGLARWTLMEHGVPIYVVPPQTLKMFTTGKGNSQKEDMKLWAFKRWRVEFTTNDECDAFALAAMGLAYLWGNEYTTRWGDFNQPQKKALTKVEPYYQVASPECRARTRGKPLIEVLCGQ